MESQQTIVWMIIACAALIGMMMFSKPLKVILKVLVRGVVGLLGIFVANLLFNPFGLTVGINILTGFIVGILGVPGFISLYIAQYLL